MLDGHYLLSFGAFASQFGQAASPLEVAAHLKNYFVWQSLCQMKALMRII